ncbi:transposase [Streptomyces fagopyri]
MKGRREGFTEADHARLLDTAHQRLGGPIVLVSANVNMHISRTLWQLIDAQPWLTVHRPPPCCMEFNLVKGVWSHLERSLTDLTEHSPDQSHRAREEPAQTAAVPARPHRLPHRQDRPRLPTAVTSAIEDL